MKAKLYISKDELSLDFQSEEDRDKFYDNLKLNETFGFTPQDAAEKVGEVTIKFNQSKFQVGYTWKICFE